jgi:capsular exopolysaccharide synthesis family protein
LSQSIDAGMSHKIVLGSNMAFGAREQYRHLAATLHNAQAASGVKVIMIASAVGGEGKTLTAANLALTFSESYERRVLLVDGNLRRPALHLLFGHNSDDPEEHVSPPVAEKARLRRLTRLLDILTAESPSSDPMADLTSEHMEGALQNARETYDWIIIDTPAVLLVPDASVVASMVEGAVLVVKAESTPLDFVQRAVEAIGKKKTLGVLVNAASRRFRRRDDQYV